MSALIFRFTKIKDQMNDFSKEYFPEVKLVDIEHDLKPRRMSKLMIETDGNGSESRPSLVCSKVDKETPMCRLLMIQMAFGITYGGNCPLFKNYPLKKFLLILYDWIVIISFVVFEFFAFSNDVFNRLFENASNKGIMCVLFRFGALSMAIEFLSMKFMLLRYGWSIVHTIKSLGNPRPSCCVFQSIEQEIFRSDESVYSPLPADHPLHCDHVSPLCHSVSGSVHRFGQITDRRVQSRED